MNLNRIVLIFGASSGIGLAAAKKLATEGAVVYNASRTPCPEQNIYNITCDVSQHDSVESAISQVIKAHNKIDILIYSAGFSMAAPLEHVMEEDYRYLFEVNYFGALRAAKTVIPFMRENLYGRIIFISSIGGILPIAFDGFYSSSKAALNMLARELSIELKPYNIFVTSVMPGGTATRFTFKRKVYPSDSIGDYDHNLNKAVISLANIEQGGMPSDLVAETVIKVLKKKNPAPVIASGISNKSYALMDKVFPSRLIRYFNSSVYKQ